MIKTGKKYIFGTEKETIDLLELECDCIGDCKSIKFVKRNNPNDTNIYVNVSYEGDTLLSELSLWERIKSCCRILFKKHIYYDDMIIYQKTLHEFIEELKEFETKRK